MPMNVAGIEESEFLVPIHGHPLALPAQLAVGRRADRSAALPVCCGALLEREQLLRAEGLVVNLRCGFDEVLQMRAGEEVAQVDEFAVSLVLDVDGAPAVLTSAHGLTADVQVLLATDNGEGDDGLEDVSIGAHK